MTEAKNLLPINPDHEWDQYVSDATQCMDLTPAQEIEYLSSKSSSLAAYLKLHPEMAHERMVPPGFKECLVRRYERYLATEYSLSSQNGDLEQARWKSNVFDATMPGLPQVIDADESKESVKVTWRDINSLVCRGAHDTLSGDKLAAQFEDPTTGESVRVVYYKGFNVMIPAQQWHFMWEHACCGFLGPTSPDDIEFHTLHTAWKEIAEIPETGADWKWPMGQRIFILKKQIEHRLRTAHIDRSNPCSACCPFRPTPLPDGAQGPMPHYEQYLTKETAAKLVIETRIKDKQPLEAVNYDSIVRAELIRRGIHCDPHGAHCMLADRSNDQSFAATTKTTKNGLPKSNGNGNTKK